MQVAKKQFNTNTESLDTGKQNRDPDTSNSLVKRFRHVKSRYDEKPRYNILTGAA